MEKLLSTALCAAGLLIASAAAGQAASYNFDFSDKAGDYAPLTASPPSSYAAAGVAGIWNVTGKNAVTGAGFTDVTGTIGGVGVAITASDTTGFSDNSTGAFCALACDNFYSAPGTFWSLEVTGLLDGIYDVYLYAPSHQSVHLGDGTANGSAFSSIAGGTSLQEGVSYTVLTNVGVTLGLLNVQVASSGSYAGLSGMQLVGAAVPLPAAGLLLIGGLGALGVAARRRKA